MAVFCKIATSRKLKRTAENCMYRMHGRITLRLISLYPGALILLGYIAI